MLSNYRSVAPAVGVHASTRLRRHRWHTSATTKTFEVGLEARAGRSRRMISTNSQGSRLRLMASWRSLAVLALAASAVVGGASVVAADAGAGKNKAEACAGCHGE